MGLNQVWDLVDDMRKNKYGFDANSGFADVDQKNFAFCVYDLMQRFDMLVDLYEDNCDCNATTREDCTKCYGTGKVYGIMQAYSYGLQNAQAPPIYTGPTTITEYVTEYVPITEYVTEYVTVIETEYVTCTNGEVCGRGDWIDPNADWVKNIVAYRSIGAVSSDGNLWKITENGEIGTYYPGNNSDAPAEGWGTQYRLRLQKHDGAWKNSWYDVGLYNGELVLWW